MSDSLCWLHSQVHLCLWLIAHDWSYKKVHSDITLWLCNGVLFKHLWRIWSAVRGCLLAIWLPKDIGILTKASGSSQRFLDSYFWPWSYWEIPLWYVKRVFSASTFKFIESWIFTGPFWGHFYALTRSVSSLSVWGYHHAATNRCSKESLHGHLATGVWTSQQFAEGMVSNYAIKLPCFEVLAGHFGLCTQQYKLIVTANSAQYKDWDLAVAWTMHFSVLNQNHLMNWMPGSSRIWKKLTLASSSRTAVANTIPELRMVLNHLRLLVTIQFVSRFGHERFRKDLHRTEWFDRSFK